MDYEIVKLEEKTVVGLSARTNNNAPDMGMIISGLWESFYQDGLHTRIPNKKNDKALGIYTDYASDEKGDYSVIVASEVGQGDAHSLETLPTGAIKKIIPAGTYAKFMVEGHMHQAVADFWNKLWKMDLPRSFVCDFEEYQNSDMEHAQIHIYISLIEK